MSNRTETQRRTGRAMRGGRRTTFVAAWVATMGLAGCDALPTEPSAMSDAVAEAAAVQEAWPQIPSTLELEVQALAMLDDGTIAGEVAATLLDAGDLAVEAEVAFEAGVEQDARALESVVDTLATKSFLAVVASSDADARLADAEDAAERIAQRLGATPGPEARLRLADAAEALARARAAGDAGDHAGTLLYAARAASALRWLDPEAKARTAVVMAEAMLDRAERLAGENPEPPLARALDRAGDLCLAARTALQNERWRLAVMEAHACARISRAIIVRLAAGIDPAILAERAEEVMAHAAAILERAADRAGEDAEPRVVLLLDEAAALLVRARTALSEERWRAAIGFAAESAARSLRVLRLLHAEDVSSVEFRATVAVEVAKAYGARVAAQIDGTTPEAIVEAAARTDALVAEAEAALEAGAWRAAWSLARRAVGLYARMLLALA